MRPVFLLLAAGFASLLWADAPQPLEPLDLLKLESLESMKISPDRQWALYSNAGLDWKNNRRTIDLWIVKTDGSGRRRLTYSPERAETAMAWSADSRTFLFLSAGSNKKSQIYRMAIDGGEPQPLTAELDGVLDFALSPDGSQVAYRSGASGARTLHVMPSSGVEPAKKISGERPYVLLFRWSPDGKSILFTSAEEEESLSSKRSRMGFNVKLNDEPKSPRNLWAVELGAGDLKRLTDYEDQSIYELKASPTGRWWAFKARSSDRFSTSWDNELYLLDSSKGTIRRLTENAQDEDGFEFSPNEKFLAYTGPDSGRQYAAKKIHLTPLPNGPVREIGTQWKYDADVSYWAPDSTRMYFTATVGVNRQIYSMPVTGGTPEPLTAGDHTLALEYDADAEALLVKRQSPTELEDVYFADPAKPGERSEWVRLTHYADQLQDRALGEVETVRWKSSDGVEVEGVLIKPVGYENGQRVPLIVQVHGGPAGTSTNSFPGRWSTYSHVYAGRGYAVLQPNYRGSSGYGEEFRTQIAGNYFELGFTDIMSGVDHLIDQGLADPDKLGHMGWSAGGHWSNWALTHTDRFKAIASGAGAVNWISMWAQSDMQINREFYFEGKPFENREHYMEVSPISYIENAKTPTLIMCGSADPRVPSPQSRELYINLQKLGVPVEYIEFPGQGHGLTNHRYMLVKMEAELAWFDKWIHGKEGWLDWEALMKTVE